MSVFEWLRVLHIGFALCSISGFALRGYWMATGNPLLQRRLAKVLPHIIDTLLLASAIGMLLIWRVSPLHMDWLLAKITALPVYIGLGMVALRFGSRRRIRIAAWLLALASAAYIVSVAYTKSPSGPLVL